MCGCVYVKRRVASVGATVSGGFEALNRLTRRIVAAGAFGCILSSAFPSNAKPPAAKVPPAKTRKAPGKTASSAPPKPEPTVAYPLPDGRSPFTESMPGSLVTWEMVPIPAAPGGKAFYMGRFEVMWDLYDIFAYRLDLTETEKAAGVDAAARPSKPYGAPDRGYGHIRYAALGMHYQSAIRFCDWVSRRTGRKYRLPTEAEWEWAATAGRKPRTLSPVELRQVAWFRDNAGDKAMEVGKLAPNPWGLFDILGNVGEFCLAPEGTEPGKEPIRGGCWNDKAPMVQFAARQYWQPDWQMSDAQIPKSKWWLSDGPYVGIRLVCDDAPAR